MEGKRSFGCRPITSTHRTSAAHRDVERTDGVGRTFFRTTGRSSGLDASCATLRADLVLYGAVNSQIFTDIEFDSIAQEGHLEHSNIVTLGDLPSTLSLDPPLQHGQQHKSDTLPITGNIGPVSNPGSKLLRERHGTSYARASSALRSRHDTGGPRHRTRSVSRAARLLPTRTGTMIPEWAVVDSTAEWMGEGGVQAAGWYDRRWGWSESMSYVQ